MNSRSPSNPRANRQVSDDDLDRLLSWGMQELVGQEEPAPHLWEVIQRKLEDDAPPMRAEFRRTRLRTAPLVQALALASLLLVFGLSLGPMMQRPSFLYETNDRIETPTHAVASELDPVGVPLKTDEGLLSGRELLRWEREQIRQQQVMARDTAPSVDPILKYRQEWRRDDLPR